MPSNRVRVGVATLVVSASTLVGVAMNESYTSNAIRPVPGDVPTIGFGETKGVKMGDRTTPVRALIKLQESMDGYAKGIVGCVSAPLSQQEFDAYLDFSYNLGTPTFCRYVAPKINAQQYDDACAEMLHFNHFHGRVLPGLIKRRQAEYRQCMGDGQ